MNESLTDRPTSGATTGELAVQLRDTRAHTRRLTEDLSTDQLMGPMLPIVNPVLWEIGHVGWFHEYWTLRHGHGAGSLLDRADLLWNSSTVAHATRWDLDLPDRNGVFGYMAEVLRRQLDRLAGSVEPPTRYFYELSIRHEDMHVEALAYTRQTLGYAPPERLGAPAPHAAGAWPGDAEVPGGRWRLGSTVADGFIFDNEKWAHEVAVAPFRIAKAPVTNAEFAAFIEAGGYRSRELWSAAGWAWREAAGAERPVYWLAKEGGRWTWRRYGRARANWPRMRRRCTSTGTRPRPGAAGPSAACRPRPNGRPPPSANRSRGFPLGREQAPLAVGRGVAEPRARQPRVRIRRSARRRRMRGRRQCLRMPADDRQCVGMDGIGFRGVSGLRRGSVRRLFAAVVQRAQGAAGRKLGHQCANRASGLPQLLHARAQRRHRRIPHLRVVSNRTDERAQPLFSSVMAI